MQFSFLIRQAASQDAADLAELNEAFNGISEPVAHLAARLADPRRVEIALLAVSAGQALGFAGLRIVPGLFYPQPLAELTELFVLPAFRRHGIGRSLLAEAEACARRSGATEFILATGSSNLTAQALYRSAGFEQDDIILRKKLF